MIVTAGHLKIRDGVPVTISNPAAAALATMAPVNAPAPPPTGGDGATVISPAKADTLTRPPAPKS